MFKPSPPGNEGPVGKAKPKPYKSSKKVKEALNEPPSYVLFDPFEMIEMVKPKSKSTNPLDILVLIDTKEGKGEKRSVSQPTLKSINKKQKTSS